MAPSNDLPTGKLARVSGIISSMTLGEVIVAIRGTSEAFLARPAVPGEYFSVGEQVVISDFQPPRTVYVSKKES